MISFCFVGRKCGAATKNRCRDESPCFGGPKKRHVTCFTRGFQQAKNSTNEGWIVALFFLLRMDETNKNVRDQPSYLDLLGDFMLPTLL